MTRRNRFTHPALLVVLGVIVLVAGYSAYTRIKHTHAVSKEKQLYATLDKQSTDYINTIAAKHPGKVTHERYCEYGSAKYGKGSLGCIVESEIKYESISSDKQEEIVESASNITMSLQWGESRKWRSYTGNKVDSRNFNISFSEVSNCGCSFRYSSTGLAISSSCGGNALAEHYPVREH